MELERLNRQRQSIEMRVVDEAMAQAEAALGQERKSPVIVVAGEDNASVELVEPGVNGLIAPSADADVLADALIAVADAGLPLRERTCAWFAENARRLSLEASLDAVSASYGAPSARA